MKLTIVALTGLIALVASQDPTPTPQQLCANKCDPSDVCCNAACYEVPCPNNLMADETTNCAAACPQGNGTAEETAKYADCQQACFRSLFFTASSMTKPTASGSQFVGAVSATATDASHTGTGTAESSSKAAQQTSSSRSSGSSATSNGNVPAETGAASQIGVQFGVAGVLGAVMAAFFL
ncbi:hypothetical protein TMatcc_009275 [Talaromyces marneffei ATCC 18224]|uniref:GPI anchored serine-threonine rich protein n=2 Tax=Talaromyces marneffei TaxID=37727 RepID=B6QMR8_TALMQ|nr:uncharacterized protein EYB26_008542 [Talaromyces marneffei]EEA21324.1 conserved hypothetical protein [Talaromyces marneffei ATCC 18224]KAE8551172.1 hypothetical protein EYB25_007408 [Talaromyces marneffei]QGA20832.1 hypothetical protein EYB26_008542 [Talaromyces marneffei]